jgi:8-oxo-dGTP pyrophosphatase MutT (NUDIX family)
MAISRISLAENKALFSCFWGLLLVEKYSKKYGKVNKYPFYLTAACQTCYSIVMINALNTASAGIIPAATVILAREQAGTLQVYLLKRSPKSGFMAGNFVFPGGTLDGNDHRFKLFSKCCDLTSDEIATRFGPALSDEQALAYCVAAVRETLEEAGIFLADNKDASTADLERINNLRLAADLEDDWFVKLVENEQWCLSLSALFSWSHWITPALMKRRFDTRFFIARMPAGQFCRPDARETVQGLWSSPMEALADNLAGSIPLSPPTLVTLHQLSKYKTIADLQTEAANRSWGQAIQPRLVPLPDGAVIVEPWDPQYHQKVINIDPEDLPSAVLPVGTSFSRIWLDQGIWKPIS